MSCVLLLISLLFIQPPTKTDLTQGHFIRWSVVGAQIETHVQPSQKNY